MGKMSIMVSSLLIFTLLISVIPIFINQAATQNSSETSGIEVSNNGEWRQISTSTITVMFPAQGQKPMFLWYYNDDSSQV